MKNYHQTKTLNECLNIGNPNALKTFTAGLTAKCFAIAILFFILTQQKIFGQCPTPVISLSASNITCPSCCDGAITSEVIAFPPYNVIWSSGETTLNINNLCAGTYTVTVEYNPACSASASITLADGNCDGHKTKVCHNNKTICVDVNAVNAHLAHGDYLGSCTSNRQESIGDNETILNLDVRVFPNPTADEFTLSYTTEVTTKVILQLYNALGQIIYSEPENIYSGNFSKKISLSKHPDGLYYVRIVVNNWSYSLPVIKKS